ncbi:hypothetical protein Avbf_14808 [Armadillidium vulgare]|nr:hypothetical protein Avbf_14808 [Armadillidium vulgare]
MVVFTVTREGRIVRGDSCILVKMEHVFVYQQPGMKISFESASNSPNIRIPNKSENEIEMERLFLNFEENDTYLKKTEKNYY